MWDRENLEKYSFICPECKTEDVNCYRLRCSKCNIRYYSRYSLINDPSQYNIVIISNINRENLREITLFEW